MSTAQTPSSTDRCPCTSGETYGACCGKYHARYASAGRLSAPTPVALMRSRFGAFAVGDVPYLLATWHRSTRPKTLELESAMRWYRLDIHAHTGTPFDTIGTVSFSAYWKSAPGTQARRGVMHETSRFERVNGEWFYLDGELTG